VGSCPALGWEAAARCPACEDGGCTKAGVVDLRDVAVKVVCVYPSNAYALLNYCMDLILEGLKMTQSRNM
jgi:hypothetical protein